MAPPALLCLINFACLFYVSCGQKGNRYCPEVPPVKVKGKLPTFSRQFHQKCNSATLSVYRSFDGVCTHPSFPYLGAARTPFFSYFGNSFNARDMAGKGLRSPREISNIIFHQFADSLVDKDYKLTEFATFFGQFLDHNIIQTSNDMKSPTAVKNIAVPFNDAMGHVRSIKFIRNIKASNRGERNVPGWIRSINTVSSAVDMFGVYGGTVLSRQLRTGDGGSMRTSGGAKKLLPLNSGKNINKKDFEMNAPKTSIQNRGKFFIAGDARSNENPQLTALHTLFLRIHNDIAVELAWKFRGKSDEWLYQSARRINQAYLQNIVYNEYLPAMIGGKLPHCPRTGDGVQCFKQDSNVGISDIFAGAAFRVGHTMVGNFVHRIGRNKKRMTNLKLSDAFFSTSSRISNDGIEPYLRGATWNQAQKIDNFIVHALRNELFENTAGEEGFDLAAINIQRGRDMNLPSFAAVKKKLLGVSVTSFRHITTDRYTLLILQEAYSTPQQVELWVGLLCEDHAPNKPMGPTLIEIWKREFERLRNGDAYFYLNRNRYDRELLKYQPLVDIIEGRGPTMKDLLIKHSDIIRSELPNNIWKLG